MQRLLWFPLYIDHFLASKKVLRMTIGEQGAYLRLLMFAWSDKTCTLPTDLQELKDLAVWTEKTDGNFEKVRACFALYPTNRKRLYNARLYEEWQKVEGLREKRREASQKRWQQPLRHATLPSNGPVKSPLLDSAKKDRTSKGLTPIESDVLSITEKYFPPLS